MKYYLHLYSRVTELCTIAEKHMKLVRGLTALEGSWGLRPGNYPTPDPGRDLSAHFQLGKSLRSRGVRGFVNYRYRGGLRDDSGCDDYVALEFNPARVDFASLIGVALPRYIEAFDPYFGHVSDEEFVFADFERSRNVNQRTMVLRVYPICYVSGDHCSRVLGLAAADVIERVRDKVEYVGSVADGVLIAARSEPVPFETSRKISDELTLLLVGKPRS